MANAAWHFRASRGSVVPSDRLNSRIPARSRKRSGIALRKQRTRLFGCRAGRAMVRIVTTLYHLFVPARLKECRESLSFLVLWAFYRLLADRAGFEPAVAVTPRTLSKRVP